MTEQTHVSAWCSPAGWRGAWAAATRRASRSAAAAILERVLTRLTPQCAALILNANGDPARFADTGLEIVPDSVPDFAGPLAGILAGLDWAAAHAPQVADVVSVPGDCPFLPNDLVTRLSSARSGERTPLACARSGEWRHPVIGSGRSTCAAICARRSIDEGLRKIETSPRAMASP